MILITSDVHIRPEAPERTERFLEFVRRAAASGPVRSIYLLGDVFDIWIGPRQPRPPAIREVFEALRDAVDQGVEVGFVPGNRDFHLDDEALGGTGVRHLGDSHEVHTGAGRLVLTHGDQFCTRDWGYRITRLVIRSLPVRVAWRRLPPGLAGQLASGFRSHSHRSVQRKPAPTMAISDRALETVFRGGADAVVCGHVHRLEHRHLAGDGWRGDLYTLRDWNDGQPHLVVDGDEIYFRDEMTNGA